jgi:hypothetical protein
VFIHPLDSLGNCKRFYRYCTIDLGGIQGGKEEKTEKQNSGVRRQEVRSNTKDKKAPQRRKERREKAKG